MERGQAKIGKMHENLDFIKCGFCGRKFYIPYTYKGIIFCAYCGRLITPKP